ncbi:uncharacterized protein [Watersipora subatra]|uniref:uncharacterized protein isoform X2 n=1 Tax=Watersipora subatra TaxID=2589382 RepID=UPI00355BAC0C
MESVNKSQPLIDHMVESELAGYRGIVLLYHPASLHMLVHWTNNTAYLGKKQLHKCEEALVTVLSGVKPNNSSEAYELHDAKDPGAILEKLKNDRALCKPSDKPVSRRMSRRFTTIKASGEKQLPSTSSTQLAAKAKKRKSILKATRHKFTAMSLYNSGPLAEALHNKSLLVVTDSKGIAMPVQVQLPANDRSLLSQPATSPSTLAAPQTQHDPMQPGDTTAPIQENTITDFSISDKMLVSVSGSDGTQRVVEVSSNLLDLEGSAVTAEVFVDEPASTVVISEEGGSPLKEEGAQRAVSPENMSTEPTHSSIVVSNIGEASAADVDMSVPEKSEDDLTQQSRPSESSADRPVPTILNEAMKRDHCYSTPNFVPLAITKLDNGNVTMMSKKEINASKELGGVGARVLKSRRSLTFYQCTICDRKVCKRQMRLHELFHRGEKPYGCSFCDKKFASKHVCRIHERIHRGERPYKCLICEKAFRQKYHLTAHEARHKKYKDGRMGLCSECGKYFSSRGGLARHAKTHTDPAEFHCQVCSKQFFTKHSLRKHSYTHKPAFHACTICDKKFRYASGLKEHAFVHTDAKPHQCKVCGKCFKMERRMKRHELLHDEEPHQCTLCELWFSSKQLLNTHTSSGQCQPSQLYSVSLLDEG